MYSMQIVLSMVVLNENKVAGPFYPRSMQLKEERKSLLRHDFIPYHQSVCYKFSFIDEGVQKL